MVKQFDPRQPTQFEDHSGQHFQGVNKGPINIVWHGTDINTTAQTTYNMSVSNVTKTDATRVIVVGVCVTGNVDITSVSIAGETASTLRTDADGNNQDCGLYARRVTIGETISVDVTCDAAGDSCIVGLWTVTGNGDPSPFYIDGHDDDLNENYNIGNNDGIAANSGAVAMACSGAASQSFGTWSSNIVEDVEVNEWDSTGVYDVTFAHNEYATTQASLVLNVTYSGASPGNCGVTAGWLGG